MKPVIYTALTGVVLYLVFLVVHLPAAVLLDHASVPRQVKLAGVQGSVWQGHVDQMAVNGLPVEEVKWHLSFWPLITGHVQLDIQGGRLRDGNKVSIAGRLDVSRQTISAQQLVVYVPSQMLLTQLPFPIPVSTAGRVKLHLAELRYQGHCQQLKGSGEWLNASVEGSHGPILLGAFHAGLSCQNNKLIMQISGANKLGLTGTVTMNEKGQYKVAARFKPAPDLPQEIQQAAALFGRPDNQGFYHIKW